MYSQNFVFTTFNHYLLYSASKRVYISSKGKLQELVDTDVNNNTHWLEIPLGRAGLLLKLLSLSSFISVCFPIQGSVYSLFTLFEDQALKLWSGSEFVLSCSGLDPHFLALWGPSTEVSSFCGDTLLFGTWSTLSLFDDQAPNFSHHGKTQSWRSFFICFQVYPASTSLRVFWSSSSSLDSLSSEDLLLYNMSIGHHSVVVPEHSLQSLLPGLTQPVLQTWNATCWGSC